MSYVPKVGITIGGMKVGERDKSTSMAEEIVYYPPTRDLSFPLSLRNGDQDTAVS